MARRNRYGTSLALGGLVLAASGAVFWSTRHYVPDSVREERRGKLLPSLRRDRLTHADLAVGGDRFQLAKENGHWFVIAGAQRYEADEAEVERVLTEAEFAEPSRTLGEIDAPSRERFGLATPRATVTLREDRGPSLTFTVGGLVADEQSTYVEVDRHGYVVPKSFGDAFVRSAMELRDRTLSSLDPTRLTRVEINGVGGFRRLEQTQSIWRLTAPETVRADRTRVEAMLHEFREMRATRYVTDQATAAVRLRYGLATPRLQVTLIRGGGLPTFEWYFGAPCEGHDDEVAVQRADSPTIACVGSAVFDALAHPAEELRDDKLVWAHPDEVERVRVHAGDAEFSVVRDHDHWRLDGIEGGADHDAVEAWLNTVTGMSAELRLDATSAANNHTGLASVTRWIEFSRTGVDGVERLEIGEPDADRMYVRRTGEPSVLGLDPSTADNLRIDAARFRSRQVIRDVPDELAALVTESTTFRDEAQKVDGTWRITRPLDALADPTVIHSIGQRLASLDADRWVALQPTPAHGLATPHLRITARFEGNGPDPDPTDATVPDGGALRPHVREYVLTLGAAVPGGGYYATLSTRPGVFVLSGTSVDEMDTPHLDRNVMEIDRDAVRSLEITRARAAGGTEHVVVRRDGDVWRTDAGGPADRTRVNALLEHLTLVRAPRAFGYGPSPATDRIGDVALAVVLASASQDAGARTVRISVGASFGSAAEAAAYARRDGTDATLSIPRDVADAIRDFQP